MLRHEALRHVCLTAALILALPASLRAQEPPVSGPIQPESGVYIPDLTRIVPQATDGQGVSATLQIMVIMTVLTLAPALLMMTTCFTRIIIVLSLLRQAIGTQQLPPGQVLTGLSLFLTFLIMAPTYEKVYYEAVGPYLNNSPGMTQERAFDIAMGHIRDFMFAQIERVENEEDVYLFLEYSRGEAIPLEERVTRADVPATVLIPAFIISELKTSFVLGFRMYLPFLVIDMVVATVLISMGMLMLPPVLISLPFKLLLFVLVDGWQLVVGTLLTSFAQPDAVTSAVGVLSGSGP
jgi:flagellar biosynthetic protein FliP